MRHQQREQEGGGVDVDLIERGRSAGAMRDQRHDAEPREPRAEQSPQEAASTALSVSSC